MVTQPKGFAPNAGGLDDRAPLARGEELFKDTTLSTNNASCNTCHASPGMYKDSFASAYPHTVVMAKDRSGMDQVTAAEMVQFCMKRVPR